MQVDHPFSERALAETSRLLNQRLSGLTAGEIRRTIRERVSDARSGDAKLLRIIVDRTQGLFTSNDSARSVYVGGTTHIVAQPEFSDRNQLQALMDLIEERSALVDALRQRQRACGLSITIGAEHTSERMRPLAVVVAPYVVGDLHGTLGVVGPTRMPYPRVAALVSHVADVAASMINA